MIYAHYREPQAYFEKTSTNCLQEKQNNCLNGEKITEGKTIRS